MDISNEIIFDSQFKKSFQKLMKLELPASLALKLVKTSREIDSQSSDVFKVRDTLLDRHCEKAEDGSIKGENGNPIFKSGEDQDIFITEMNSILADTFQVTLEDKIVLPETSFITAEDILALEKIIKFD